MDTGRICRVCAHRRTIRCIGKRGYPPGETPEKLLEMTLSEWEKAVGLSQ